MARQDFSDGVLEDHVQVAFQQELFQSADGVQHLGTAQATDNADIAKLLHGAPAGFGVRPKRTIMGERLRQAKPFVAAKP
jgi:hypothetical protein